MDERELWADLDDFPAYQVSTHGRVRRIAPSKSRGAKPGTILKPGHRRGYQTVMLYSPEHPKGTNAWVHRLVALTFIGQAPHRDMQVAHWDDVKSNNRLDNLRWATPAENIQDATRNGIISEAVAAELCGALDR
jgi:hypothetical protein